MDAARLVRIVEDASTLAERLGDAFRPRAEGAAAAGARLDRWRARVSGGDPARFERRIRWEGVTPERMRERLGAVELRDPSVLPSWSSALADAVALLDAPAPGDRTLDAADPLPFEALLLPFVEVARRRVRAAAGRRGAHFAPAAHAAWERALLRRLCDGFAQALFVDFAAFRSVRDAGGTAPAGAYAEFVEQMRCGGMATFLARYPVLARMASTQAEQSAAAVAELLARLGADRRLLRAAFAGGAPLGRVEGLHTALSDPHRGGRTVSILRFRGGARAVYKPRPLALDAAFHELLRWLRAEGVEPELRAPAVIDRGTHGWAEFAAAAPCGDEAEVELYFHRAGMLLCLAYLLGGSDFHSENVVACGPHPVLVDLEVLMGAPARERLADGAAGAHLATALWDSVLRTHLLPGWSADEGGARQEGGLVSHPSTPRRVRMWRDVNTDFMAPAVAPAPVRPGHNLPVLDGRVRDAASHRHAIVAGFRRMHAALRRRRAELLRPGGALDAFAGHEVRTVLRNTRLYAKLARRMLHPDFLRSGADRSIEIEALCTPLLRADEPGALWTVFGAERADLENFDVPIFSIPAAGTRLVSSAAAPLGELRDLAGHAEARRRVAAMGPADARVQTWLILNSFEERAPRPDGDAPPDLAAEAEAIADDLGRLARDGRRGAEWLAPARGFEPLSPTRLSLDHGRAGIALFLASVGRPADAELALRALARTPATGRGWSEAARARGIGGARGVGGVMYALARVGSLLDAPPLLRAAAGAAEAVTPRRIRADAVLDVYGGSAGAALGLLALHRATGDAAALARAEACARHLLDRQLPAGGWATGKGGEPATGFAHGAAGIAHALLRVARATGDAALRLACQRAAAEAHACESRLLEAGNWREREGDGVPADAIWCAWCRGAAGIGMQRAAAAELLGPEVVRADVETAVETVLRLPPHRLDHLCCGTLGRTETLLSAAALLGRPGLAAEAVRRAGAVALRAARAHGYSTGMQDFCTPGLFQGTAGIGLQLLRLARPLAVPAVLLWD